MKRIWDGFTSLVTKLFTSMGALVDASRADKLIFAAFIVATLRQMGVNGHFIGYDPASNWAWFQPAEVWSGVAMALLIGVALAYISRRWRRLDPKTLTEWIYWSVLMGGMLIVLICEIFYISLYAYAAQRQLTVATTFTPEWNMLWNVTIAGVLPLMAILIGIVTDDDELDDGLEAGHVISQDEDAWLTLLEMVKAGNTKVMPSELASAARISIHMAGKIIQDAYDMGLLK